MAMQLIIPPGGEYSKETMSSKAGHNPAKPTQAKKDQQGIRQTDTWPQTTMPTASIEDPSDLRNQPTQSGRASIMRRRAGPFPEPFEHIKRDGWKPPIVKVLTPREELSSLSEDSPSQHAPISRKAKGKAREVTGTSNQSQSNRTQSSMAESSKPLK
jgi:hypothetical protein